MNWKNMVAVALALLVGLGALVKLAIRMPQPPEHQVFINGVVLTMDPDNRVAQALATRGDRIEAVGSTEDIMALVDDSTEVVDLRGKTLLPGFIDAHGHFPGSGMKVISADLNSPPIGKVTTIAQLLAALKVQAEKTPDGWITGFGYDDTLIAEKRHPTRAELDTISSTQPVVITHVSGHMLVANSVALALAGISADTPDPDGGVIGRRAGSKEPNGLLQENASFAMTTLSQKAIGIAQIYRMIKSAQREYASVGVTTAQSGGVTPQLATGLSVSSKLGVIPQRLVLFPFEHEFRESLLNGDYDPDDYNSDRLVMGAVKIIADGSIQGYTGYLEQPYFTPYHGDADYRGFPNMPRQALIDKVVALHKAGYQIAIHANGDAAIEDALVAFAAAQKARPKADPRMILIHAQMARKDQIDRMKALGVTPSFFTAHTYYWGDRHRDIFMGPERAAQISPERWAQQQGLRFSSHLDTPVTPMRPLQAVWSQVFRQTTSGATLGEEQRVDVMTALRAVTIDAAWQVFQDDNRGSLEPGKYADLVVLSADPRDNPAAMRELKVERTVVGGATIYLGEP